MRANDSFHIAVLPGDGIGPEVMAPALAVLDKVAASTPGLKFRFTEGPAGAGRNPATRAPTPATTLKLGRQADGIPPWPWRLPPARTPANTRSTPPSELAAMVD